MAHGGARCSTDKQVRIGPRNLTDLLQVGSGGSGYTLPDGISSNALGGGSKWDLAKKGIGTRLASVGAYGQQRAINAAKRSLKSAPKTAGRMVRRGALGALGGGTAALLALGAGAATGDPSKALGLVAAAGAARI